MLDMLNEKIRKMSVVDILMGKIFPGLLSIGYPVLIIVILSLGAKPLYKMWFQK